jgi:hypothetical protein
MTNPLPISKVRDDLYRLLGMEQLASSLYSSITTFSLVPIPLFILMGNHTSYFRGDTALVPWR